MPPPEERADPGLANDDLWPAQYAGHHSETKSPASRVDEALGDEGRRRAAVQGKTPKEFANLDFLRAYAVLSVYAGHVLQTFGITRVAGRVTMYDIAQTGVLIFFVHTSLVLMLSMERLAAERPRFFTAFYIRRIFRIYPLSIFTVTLMTLTCVPVFPTMGYSWPGWTTLLSNLALVQNLTGSNSYPLVLWSLPYEVQMYAVLPLLFVLIRRFRSRLVPIGLWLCDVAIILVMLKLGLRTVPLQLLRYTPCFLGGIIGYRLWHENVLRLDFWAWPCMITLCVGIRILAEASGLKGATTVSAWLVCLFLGLAAPQFRQLGGGWLRTLAGWVAKYSYGIYLSHCVVLWIAFVLLKAWPFWAQTLVCMALSVLAPVGLYHGIENPMIQVGTRLARRSAREPGERSQRVAA